MRFSAHEPRAVQPAEERASAHRALPSHVQLLTMQRTAGNAAVARMLGRKQITLPHPKRSEDKPPVTMESSERERVKAWLDQATVANRPALSDLIDQLEGETGAAEKWMLMLAQGAVSRGAGALVTEDGSANVTATLVDAARVDIAKHKGYLQEGDGERLAQHWGVDAEVFDQPRLKESIIRPVTRYGAGRRGDRSAAVRRRQSLRGHPTVREGRRHYHSTDGRYFRSSAVETVAEPATA